MGLIRHKLRVFFRSHFQPIDKAFAAKWEFNFKVIYFVTAWTLLGFSVYVFNSTKTSDPTTRRLQMTTPYDSIRKYGGDEENTIIHIKGLGKIEYEVVNKEDLTKKKT